MSGKETLKIIDRFVLKHKLGQGTFSYIYEAYDKHLCKEVALKVEKKDKNKTILLFEYNVLLNLKGLKHVAGVYDFVQNSEQNLIVMDLLGINLARARRCLEQTYSLKITIHILLEMLVAIQEVHDRGFIHRDVKASNFVLCKENRRVFIVDFGLAKKHLNNDMQVMPKRKKADFRGTVSFASLNAHNNIDLARRDDLWSFYFTMLDFLNEKLEWREVRDYSINQVKDIKTKCLKQPQKKLWVGPTAGITEVEQIFNLIDKLQYQDRPNYLAIENLLLAIYNNYDMVGLSAQKATERTRETEQNPNTIKWQLIQRSQQVCPDLQRLNKKMKSTRQQDFMDYFNNHKLCQPSKPQQTNLQLAIHPEQAKSTQNAAIYPVVQLNNPPLQFDKNANGLANVAKVVDHLGSLVNDFCQPRLQQGHLPLPDMNNKNQIMHAGSIQDSTGNGLIGNQGVLNSSSNLQPLQKLLQSQNFVQQNQQQRSQLLNKLPIVFHHREPLATPPDEQLNNQNMGHQGNFFYQHNPAGKSQQNINTTHLTLVNSMTDPYNLMVANDNHNNQGMMQQTNSDQHTQHMLMQQQQAQLLQNEGLLGGMHYLQMFDPSLQNFTASNFFALHQSQANNNMQNIASEFAQNPNGYGQQNTPRMQHAARQQLELFNNVKLGKSQQSLNQQNQMLAQQQMNSNNFMQLQQPQKLQLQDFQNHSQDICQNLAGNVLNGLSHINQQDKASQLQYLESANQLLRQTAEHNQLNQKLRIQQQQFLNNLQENSKEYQYDLEQERFQSQRNQQINLQKNQAYQQIKDQLMNHKLTQSNAVNQSNNNFMQSKLEQKKINISPMSPPINNQDQNGIFAQQTQQESSNLRQQQKQIQVMQNEVNRLQQGVTYANQQYQDQKYQEQMMTRQGLRSQRKENPSASNVYDDGNNGYGGDAESNQLQHQFKKQTQESSLDCKGLKKREVKKQSKLEEQPNSPQMIDNKVSSDNQNGIVRRKDGKLMDQKEQQLINQHIIYAPQIIFMGNQPQKVGGEIAAGQIESGTFGDGENKEKYYYYDPQRIERSKKPIFKTEKLLLNRPGYSQLIQQKFTHMKDRQGQYDVLPGQDQDFQQDILPYVEMPEQGIDGQMNFQLDTDKNDLLNFLPGGSLE